MLRMLLIVVIAVPAAWGGYWFVGSRALERAVDDWISDTPEVTAEALVVRGFPNRFDLTLTRPTYAQAGTGWSAPFAQVFSLSYRPNHLLLVFPNDQRLTFNGDDWTVHSVDLRASIVTRPRSDLVLERATLVGEGLRAQGPRGERLQAETLRLASRLVEDDSLSHDIGAELQGLRPDPALLALLDPGGAMPLEIEQVYLDARVRLDRELELQTASRTQVQQIDLRRLSLNWGALKVLANGALDVDAAGLLSGEVDATLTNWQVLLDGARAAELWDPGLDPLIAGLLGGLARENGDETTLTLPLQIDRGVVHLGPFALATLPAF